MKKLFAATLLAALFTLPLPLSAAESDPMALPAGRTALVVTDPQNDFLHKEGIAYGLFAENMEKLGTIDNLERLFRTATKAGLPIFVSPHAYFPHDHRWKEPGALQKQLLELKVFERADPLYAKGLEGSGADILARYKPYMLNGDTVITSPHKVYGPDSNDLLLQLRSRDITTVILAGLAANLCTDSHLRELVKKNGFKVAVVKDAVAAPGANAYEAALTNYGMIANAVWSTDEAVAVMTR